MWKRLHIAILKYPLKMLQSLQNVANVAVPSKCCKCCKDFKNVANVAEPSKGCKCCRALRCRDFKNVANVRGFPRLKKIFALLHLCLEVIKNFVVSYAVYAFRCCFGHLRQHSLALFRHCRYVGYQRQRSLLPFRHCYCLSCFSSDCKILLFHQLIYCCWKIHFCPEQPGSQYWKTFLYSKPT